MNALGKPINWEYKILSMVACPEDISPRLNYEKELEVMFLALDDLLQQDKARIDIMEDGCLETLEKRQDKNTYYVVHISCHGGVKNNENVLYLEEHKTWKARPVTGRQLS